MYLMVEFYVDIRVVLILVFVHGPPTLLALTGQGIREVVFKFKIIITVFTKSLKQCLYRGESTKQLLLIYLPFIVDILEANYDVLFKQTCEYFTGYNTTSRYISNYLVCFISTLTVMW
jgi:hypothetical protein